MTPANIAGMAYVKGLDVIAVTDHNSIKNCEATAKAGEAFGLTVLFGMELTTQEEVHVVCLFPSIEKAAKWDEYVYDRLMKIQNDPDIFGHQYVMNSEDGILHEEKNLLINAADIDFERVFPLVDEYGGVAFPAHIDKSSNSLISNLGFVPPDSQFGCVEIKDMDKYKKLCSDYPYLSGCRVLKNSDAHRLEDISEPVNFLHSESKSPDDIIFALKKKTTDSKSF